MLEKNKNAKEQRKIPFGFTLHQKFREQNGIINDMSWSPDGQMLAIATSNNTIQVCDVVNRKVIWTLRGPSSRISSITWSPDGKNLASGCGDTIIWLWNIKTGKTRRKQLKGHTDWVWKVSWSPDGKTLASSSRDGTILLWNMKTMQCQKTLKWRSYTEISEIVWSLDSQTLTSLSLNLRGIWNAETGEMIDGSKIRVDNYISCMAGLARLKPY